MFEILRSTPLRQMWNKHLVMRKNSEIHLEDAQVSPTTSAIYFYIAANRSNMTQLSSHPYFNYVSLSTIKRSILELKAKNLIKVTTDSQDRRIKWFSIKREG
jgi:DNA-binding MarR family transcriptional regulator